MIEDGISRGARRFVEPADGEVRERARFLHERVRVDELGIDRPARDGKILRGAKGVYTPEIVRGYRHLTEKVMLDARLVFSVHGASANRQK